MADNHNTIIARAAKAELAPVGFKRRGRSRLWIADRGSWLNVVEFTPSRWSISVTQTNAVHLLWTGVDFMSFDVTSDLRCSADSETAEQFGSEVARIVAVARDEALKFDAQFASFDETALFLVERAKSSPDRMGPSWWGYKAGIASALTGKMDDARRFLEGITDERVTSRAAELLPLLDHTEAFKRKINEMVDVARTRLGLEALSNPAF